VIRGVGKITVSQDTVIEALQAWAAATFAPGHVPKIVGFSAAATGFGVKAQWDLTVEEVPEPVPETATAGVANGET